MPMTSRERVERAIRFEKPDRVPFNFWMDRRSMEALETKYGPEFRLNHYGADVVEAFVPLAFPVATFEERSGTNWMVKEAFEDWTETEAITLPDPNDPALYALMEQALREHPDHAVVCDLPNVLTMVETMRRQENFFIDILTCGDLVKAFFERVSDVMAAAADRVCRMDITALYVMDDVGYNNGIIMSPDQFREFVYPYWKKVIDVGHSHGKPVFFHTDGKVDALWETFADDLGVRMLNPLQPNLQSIEDFKKRYHGKMGVYGGLHTAEIHTMSPEEVRAHVFDLFEKAGAGGGLIMSTHDIDHTVAEETLDAMVAAIKDCVY